MTRTYAANTATHSGSSFSSSGALFPVALHDALPQSHCISASPSSLAYWRTAFLFILWGFNNELPRRLVCLSQQASTFDGISLTTPCSASRPVPALAFPAARRSTLTARRNFLCSHSKLLANADVLDDFDIFARRDTELSVTVRRGSFHRTERLLSYSWRRRRVTTLAMRIINSRLGWISASCSMR